MEDACRADHKNKGVMNNGRVHRSSSPHPDVGSCGGGEGLLSNSGADVRSYLLLFLRPARVELLIDLRS